MDCHDSVVPLGAIPRYFREYYTRSVQSTRTLPFDEVADLETWWLYLDRDPDLAY